MRGAAEWPAHAIAAPQSIDTVGFRWSAMELFDEPGRAVEAATRYRPRNLAPYSIAKARERILQRLAAARQAQTLDRLLPEDDGNAAKSQRLAQRRRRSAWSSTFVASLELAKQGVVVLTQEDFLMPVSVDEALRNATLGRDHGKAAAEA